MAFALMLLAALTLRLPHIALAQTEPVTVRAEARIARDVENRWVEIVLRCDVTGVDDASAAGIDGANGPVLFVREYRDLTAGNYTAVARLHRRDGREIVSDTVRFEVLSRW